MLYLVEKVPIYITNKGGSRRRKKVINAERERERERETERDTHTHSLSKIKEYSDRKGRRDT